MRYCLIAHRAYTYYDSLRGRRASGRLVKILESVNGPLRLFRDIAEFNYFTGIHVMSSNRIDVGRIFAFRESVCNLSLVRS